MANPRYDTRKTIYDFYNALTPETQTPNGDEAAYAGHGHYASYTKGLIHNDVGIASSFSEIVNAFTTGTFAAFETINLGAVAKGCVPAGAPAAPSQRLVDPQAGLATDTEGIDPHFLAMKAAPRFDSAEEIGEIAENYWMALARDVPFTSYGDDAIIVDAVADMNRFTDFRGPKGAGSKITSGTIFRGLQSDTIGPYLSQFMLLNIPYGAQKIMPQITYALPDKDYLMDPAEYVGAQNGCVKSKDAVEEVEPRHIYRGRDLAQYVHIDELYQAYLNACLMLITPKDRGGWGANLGKGNPYTGYDEANTPPIHKSTQVGFGTLGEPNFKTIVTEVATRALKAVWYQKWGVHRRLRPEAFAARIHFHKVGGHSYHFDAGELAKLETVLDSVHAFNAARGAHASYLLPMAFPEGCPMHPAYGAGHATVAGACVTILKALFHEQDRLIDDLGIQPMLPTRNGMFLKSYSGSDARTMTVGSELNKLAANVGMARNFAGVHWRSDYSESVLLGERIALYLLQEHAQTYNEPAEFRLTRFKDFTSPFDESKQTVIKKGDPLREFPL